MTNRIALLSVLFLVVAVSAKAQADTDSVAPKGSYVFIDPPEDGAVEAHDSNIIYLNACWGNCTITRGYPDDSRTNRSSIPRSSTSTVSEFQFGQSTWDAVVTCVKDIYEPFNIEITDQDPGSQSHFEAIVAGTPEEVGMGNGVGGVSPFSCGVIDNAITYSFANIYGGSVQAICEVVAQETAHAFGLEHEYHCPDPMTYLNGCGPKRFRDIDAECGEFSARQCDCGGSTQNSVRMMMSEFGPSMPTPPTIDITEPADGATVQPGFVIRINATDNVAVERTELYLNGSLITTLNNKPFVFNAPATLGQGNVIVEVRGFDNRGDMGSSQITVALGEPCTKSSQCEDTQACVDGRCVVGPGETGGLGESCTDGDQCASTLCGNDGTDQFCTELCDPDDNGCPGGFECIASGTGGVCWPGGGGGGGGCSVSGGSPAAPVGLAVLVGMLMLAGRRRRRS